MQVILECLYNSMMRKASLEYEANRVIYSHKECSIIHYKEMDAASEFYISNGGR
jgi:hypothetical protein